MTLDPMQPHRRLNLLTGEWVLVSPHRTQRPWQGQVEDLPEESSPEYDPKCYLCPGNDRAGGGSNPPYTGTYVFDNDYPALLPDTAPRREDHDGLLVAQSEAGRCRVVCFSPRHDLTLATMERADIRRVVDVWAQEYRELGALPYVSYVQVFENRGAMMGASNPHPHGQIWATSSIPNEPWREGLQFQRLQKERGKCLLCEYSALELKQKERMVYQNDHFSCVVPYWAVWPFETLICSRRHVRDLVELQDVERDSLADVLQRLTAGYNRIFNTSFPYSMGIHQRPTDGLPHEHWHLHLHFYPPLLRSATVRKFMVGFEMLGGPQRDITAEAAAARLRECVG